jgi:hypothetical protein
MRVDALLTRSYRMILFSAGNCDICTHSPSLKSDLVTCVCFLQAGVVIPFGHDLTQALETTSFKLDLIAITSFPVGRRGQNIPL